MKEDFSYSRSQYEQTRLGHARRRRWEIGACVATVIALMLIYLNERSFHWW